MSETHVPGHTTTTPTREAQDFTQLVHEHDIRPEIDALLDEARVNASHRAAKTLSKDFPLNLVLMAVQGGVEIKDHQVHGAAVLHVLQGRLKIHLDGREIELGADRAVSFAREVPHRLEAVEDCAFMVVLAAR